MYNTADASAQQAILDFYLENTARINNWDLVDAAIPRTALRYAIKRFSPTERKRLLVGKFT